MKQRRRIYYSAAQRSEISGIAGRLACRPFLSRTVSIKLQRQWSPEQIAGWLKRTYPREPQNQGNHPVSSHRIGGV